MSSQSAMEPEGGHAGSAIAIVHLWMRRRAPWWKRVLWSFALLVPCIGPLLYASLFSDLSAHRPGMRPEAGQGGIDYPLEPPHDHR